MSYNSLPSRKITRPSLIPTTDNIQGLNPASNYVNYPPQKLPENPQVENSPAKVPARSVPNPVANYRALYPGGLQGQIIDYNPLSDTSTPVSVFEYASSTSPLNSSPAHLYPTTTTVQIDTTSPDSTGVPIAIHVNPFASPAVGEAEIPLVDTGEDGPIRCVNCALYATSNSRITEKGVWVCEQCGWTTNVPLDKLGRFNDYLPHIVNTPTIEYLVRDPRFIPILQEGKSEENAKLMSRLGLKVGTSLKTIPVFRILLIHTSKVSSMNGMISAVCEGAIAALDQMNDNVRLGVVTYDHAVSAFDFNPDSTDEYPTEIIMPTVDQPSAFGSPYRVCRPLSETREKIRKFLTDLPQILAERPDYNATDHAASFGCFGSALEAIHDTFKSLGGLRITAYVSSSDTHGTGRTGNTLSSAMEPPKEKLTDMIKTKKDFWDTLADRCLGSKISVDVISNGPAFCDLDAMLKPSSITNGYVKHYDNADSGLATQALVRQDIYEVFSRKTGYSATIRTRCTRGLNTDRWYGNISFKDLAYNAECSPINIDEKTSLCVKLRHEERLDAAKQYFTQIAVLYTHEDGTRRVRLLHYFFRITPTAAEIYKTTSVDAIAGYITKYCLRQERTATSSNNTLFQQIVKPLVAYRSNYYNAPKGDSKTKLVVPKGLDCLIYYAYMIHTLPAFQGSMNADIRFADRCNILGSRCDDLLKSACPFVFNLTAPEEGWMGADTEGNIVFPAPLRPSLQELPSLQDSVLLYSSASENYLFIGKNISLEASSGLCDVEYFNTLSSYRSTRPLVVVRESEYPHIFRKLAKEDKNGDLKSLSEFMGTTLRTVASRADAL